MKTIKNSKEITTLEVDDVVVFGDLEYIVTQGTCCKRYYLVLPINGNDKIFKVLNINKIDFIEKLGINAFCDCPFPETKSLEALTAIVSALFKEYEKQNELPKTWEEFCERNSIKRGECLISPFCKMHITEAIGIDRNVNEDRNYCISESEGQAFLALMQLRQLRKAYVRDWEPDWKNDISVKYCIEADSNEFLIRSWYHQSHTLSFPTQKLAKQFLNNFKNLLEIAKPLL